MTNQLADLNFNGVARITNLPDAVSAQQPATKAQLDAVAVASNAATREYDEVRVGLIRTMYTGVAPVGSLPSQAVYVITRSIFNSIGELTSEGVATGATWDDRYTETYL